MPRTLSQVLNEANEAVVQGDLSNYIPIPTGFDPLDAAIGSGLQRGELVLLGGAQGIGKTITAMQMARQYREWVVFTIEKNRAGQAMIDVEFHLDAPYFCFNPSGQMVQQQLIDDKIIEA